MKDFESTTVSWVSIVDIHGLSTENGRDIIGPLEDIAFMFRLYIKCIPIHLRLLVAWGQDHGIDQSLREPVFFG